MKTHSFDLSFRADIPHIKEAIVQTMEEIALRWEFEKILTRIDCDEKEKTIVLTSTSESRLHLLYDILLGKLIKYGIHSKSLIQTDRRKTGDTQYQAVYRIVDAMRPQDADAIQKELASLHNVRLTRCGEVLRVLSDSLIDLQKALERLRPCFIDSSVKLENYR